MNDNDHLTEKANEIENHPDAASPEWWDELEWCPDCGEKSVYYVGRIQDEHGDWVDHWTCHYPECGYYYEH